MTERSDSRSFACGFYYVRAKEAADKQRTVRLFHLWIPERAEQHTSRRTRAECDDKNFRGVAETRRNSKACILKCGVSMKLAVNDRLKCQALKQGLRGSATSLRAVSSRLHVFCVACSARSETLIPLSRGICITSTYILHIESTYHRVAPGKCRRHVVVPNRGCDNRTDFVIIRDWLRSRLLFARKARGGSRTESHGCNKS